MLPARASASRRIASSDGAARGVYTIVAKLPEEGNVPQYRIKAKTDGRERVAREDQLEPA